MNILSYLFASFLEYYIDMPYLHIWMLQYNIFDFCSVMLDSCVCKSFFSTLCLWQHCDIYNRLIVMYSHWPHNTHRRPRRMIEPAIVVVIYILLLTDLFVLNNQNSHLWLDLTIREMKMLSINHFPFMKYINQLQCDEFVACEFS